MSTTTTVTNTSAVSNSSFFLIDADYLDNTGSNGFGSSTVDNQDDFVYTTAIANNSLYVYDLPDEAPEDIGGFNSPVSVLYVPQTYYQGVLFVSNAGNGTVDVMSDNSTGGIFGLILQRLGEVSLSMPGSIAYDSTSGLVYVGYGNGSQSGIGIIDENTSSELGTIPLSAQPGQLAVEQNGTRIFVNIPSLGEVDVIDKTTRQVVASWSIGAAGNVAMALDEADGRLFVGASNPATFVVLDDNSGHIIGSYPLTSAPDDLVYDPQSGLILASCIGGTLDGYQELNPNSFALASSQASSPGASSEVLLESLDQVLLAAPQYSGQSAQVLTFQIYPS
jgi:DNA-binding beta-propeller fold protein YncE